MDYSDLHWESTGLYDLQYWSLAFASFLCVCGIEVY